MKKLLSMLLTLAMVLSLVPAAVAAEPLVKEDLPVVDNVMTEVGPVVDAVNGGDFEDLKDAVADLLLKYDEAYAEAYNMAEGYIAAADEALAALAAEIENIDEEELQGVKAEALEDIAALQALLAADDAAAFVKNGGKLLVELEDDLAELEGLYNEYAPVVIEALSQIDAYVSDYLAAEYAIIVDYITDLANEYGPAAEEFVTEWLIENPQAIMDSVMEYGAEIDAFINYWGYYVELILGPVWEAYGEEALEYLDSVMNQLGDALEAEAAHAADHLVQYIVDLDLCTKLDEIAAGVEAGAAAIGADVYGDVLTALETLEENVTWNVAILVLELMFLAESEDGAIAYDIIMDTIETIRAEEAALLEQIAKIEAEVLVAMEQIDDAAAKCENLLDVAGYVNGIYLHPEQMDFSETPAAAWEIVEMLLNAMVEVEKAANQIATETEVITVAAQAIDDSVTTLYADLKAASGDIAASLEDAGVAAEALMGDAFAAVENLAVSSVVGLGNLVETSVVTAVDAFVTAVVTTLYYSVYGDLALDCNAEYVSIGDEDDVYTSELAALLQLAEDQIVTELAGADLVTVNFTTENFGAYINEQITGIVAETIKAELDDMLSADSFLREPAEKVLAEMGIDLNATAADVVWENLDAKAGPVVEEMLAGVETTLLDNGMLPEVYVVNLNKMLGIGGSGMKLEIPVADIVMEVVENFVYAYAVFLTEYSAELAEIHAAAPEAVIAVLGEEAADELIVGFGDLTIDVTDYVDVTEIAAAFINVHYFAYALGTQNIFFVAENSAEAIYAALNVSYNDHVWGAWECDDENHWHYCELCGILETGAHEFDGNVCVACGYEKEDVSGGGSGGGGGLYGFSDVPTSHPFYKEIMWAFRKGYIQGYADGNFGPSNNLTRQHVWMILARHAGEKPADMAEARAWAMANGVSDGTNPGVAVTRQQLVAMFFRYATLKGYNVADEADITVFPDATTVAAYAKDPMEWAIAEGIIKGYADGTLQAPGLTNRGQFAAVLYRFCESIK